MFLNSVRDALASVFVLHPSRDCDVFLHLLRACITKSFIAFKELLKEFEAVVDVARHDLDDGVVHVAHISIQVDSLPH